MSLNGTGPAGMALRGAGLGRTAQRRLDLDSMAPIIKWSTAA